MFTDKDLLTLVKYLSDNNLLPHLLESTLINISSASYLREIYNPDNPDLSNRLIYHIPQLLEQRHRMFSETFLSFLTSNLTVYELDDLIQYIKSNR